MHHVQDGYLRKYLFSDKVVLTSERLTNKWKIDLYLVITNTLSQVFINQVHNEIIREV